MFMRESVLTLISASVIKNLKLGNVHTFLQLFTYNPYSELFFCTSEFHSETSLNLKIRFSKPFIELFVRKGLESVK
jgi:hypothetical protein